MTMNGEAAAMPDEDTEYVAAVPDEVAAPVPDLPRIGVPLARKLDREDLLEIENLYLKAENVRLQIGAQQAEIVKSGQLLNGIKEDLRKKQVALSKKYGVDFQNVHVGLDGTITPQAAPAPKA